MAEQALPKYSPHRETGVLLGPKLGEILQILGAKGKAESTLKVLTETTSGQEPIFKTKL